MVFTVGTGRLIPARKICQVLDLGSQGSAQVRSDLYQLAFPTGSSLLRGHLGGGQLWSIHRPAHPLQGVPPGLWVQAELTAPQLPPRALHPDPCLVALPPAG